MIRLSSFFLHQAELYFFNVAAFAFFDIELMENQCNFFFKNMYHKTNSRETLLLKKGVFYKVLRAFYRQILVKITERCIFYHLKFRSCKLKQNTQEPLTCMKRDNWCQLQNHWLR